jgi:hypothetical protein
LIEAVGVFDLDVEHPGLGSISRGTVSHEFYWPESGTTFFGFTNRTADFATITAISACRPRLRTGVLDYVDLDIDVSSLGGLRYDVLDQ